MIAKRDIESLLGDATPEAIFLHSPNGTVRYAAPGCEAVLGASPLALVGTSLIDRMATQERPRLIEGLLRAHLRGQAYGPVLARTNDAAIRWVEMRTRPVHDNTGSVLELHTTMRDVTKRIKIHEDLSIKERLEREANQLSHVGAWRVDLDTGDTYWSDEVRRIFEVDDAFIPTPDALRSFYSEESDARAAKALEVVMATGETQFLDVQITTAKGRAVWIHVILKCETDHGRPVRLYGALQDVTQRRQQDADQKQLVEELTRQRDRMAEFGHMVTHNLRGPVCNLVTLARLVHESNDESEATELFKHISSSADQLLAMMDDVGAVLQVERDGSIADDVVDLNESIKSVVTGFSADIHASGARIEWDVAECPTLAYPRVYLETILRHLISNALAFTTPDRTPDIRIRCWNCDGHVCLDIADNGAGIDLARYGDSIFRLRTTFHRGNKGRGVGLFTIRNIVESMGGEITVDSILGKGSTFRINFTRYKGE